MGWWFGRKAVEPARPFVPAWLQVEGEQGGYVRGYEAQLDEVYRRNPVGLRAVRLVSGLVGALPLFAKEGNAKAVELLCVSGVLEQASAGLLLHGNAYVRLVVDGHDRPAELHCMRPERVSVACGPDGWPSAYLYRAGGEVTRIAKRDALGRQQVAHLRALNPGDDHYGLQRIDMLLCPVVEGPPIQSPPTSPNIGSCFLIASAATGAWSGRDGTICCFTDGGWRFVPPIDGASVLDKASGQMIVWRNGVWEAGIVKASEVHINGEAVLRNRQPAIADPAGGSVTDTECRSAVASILVALRAHGLIA